MLSKTLYLLFLLFLFQTHLQATETPSSTRFLFLVDKESIEEIADRFSTTPDTILGIRALIKNKNVFLEREGDTSVDLQSGDILSLNDSPPFKIVDLGSDVSLSEASEKFSIPSDILAKLNTFTLAKNHGKQRKYVIQEVESLWSINRKKYEWGWQSLGSLFVPIYIVSLFLFGFGMVIALRKFLGSSGTIVKEEPSEKKEKPFVIIEVLNGNHKGKRVKIEQTDFTIGRDAGSNHALTLEGESRVSGKHVRIHLKPDGWVLNDLQSKGGTLINKRDISKDTKLSHGLIVELGFEGIRLKLEPFTPEVAKAYGAKSTTEIKRIAKEANAGELSQKTKIFSFVIFIICLTIAGFGYKTLVLENRISLVEENVLRHQKTLASMKMEIGAMDSRILSLEKSRTETESRLRNFAEKILEVSKKTEQNSREIKTLQDRLDKLPTKLQSFQTRSVEFSSAVKDLNSSVIQKKPEDEIQKKLDIVKEKFESLKTVAGELQIDVEDVEKSTTRIEVEPEKENESGVKIVDLLRGVKKSMRGVNPILKASFDILHSLVDNRIVLTLAPLVKEAGVLGIFGFLL